jgi:putative ABC transport system permease protein
MMSIFQDLHHAARMLSHDRRFAAAAICTLALGIGSTAAVYSILDAVLLKPLAFDRPERVFALRVREQGGGEFGVTAGLVEAVRGLPAIERTAAAISAMEQNLVSRSELAVVSGAAVTRDFFEVFGVRPIVGRTFSDYDGSGPAPLVIGERIWRQRFAADREILGRTVRLDDTTYTVVGVMPGSFAQPDDATYWRFFEPSGDQSGVLGAGPYHAVARVGDAGVEAARSQAEVLSGTMQRPGAGALGITLTPVLETMTSEYERVLQLVMGAVMLVLLISCGNVAVLLLARTGQRARELSVRAAIGATRRRLVRQLFTESVLLAGCGAVAGCALAWMLVRAVPALGAVEMPRLSEASVDLRALTFTLILSATSVLLFGLAPAFVSTTREGSPSQARGAAPRANRRTAKSLIALEIALTLALLIGSTLTMAGLYRTLNVDLGFDRDRLSIATVRPSSAKYAGVERSRFFERVVDRLRDLPGIEAAGGMSMVPLASVLPERAAVGADDGTSIQEGPRGARFRTITSGALGTLRAAIVKGRDFAAHDSEGGTLVTIVNETLAARLWPGRDPVGQALRVTSRTAKGEYQVVGVVRDIRGTLALSTGPEFYLPASQRPLRSMTLVVRSPLDARTLGGAIGDAVASVDPEQPVTTVTSMGMLMWQGTAYNRFRAVLLTLFALFAVALAVTGILGVVSHAVTDRTRELGVRLAIGATPSQLVSLVMRDLAWPVAAGVVGGFAVTYNLSSVLRGFLGIQGFDAVTWAAAALGLVLLAAVAAWLPARRAGRVDPMLALRAE